MIWQSGPESILAASFKTDGGISSKATDFIMEDVFFYTSEVIYHLRRLQIVGYQAHLKGFLLK